MRTPAGTRILHNGERAFKVPLFFGKTGKETASRLHFGPMDESEWLEARKKYVTATQACAVVDAHPYTLRDELLSAKRGYPKPFVPNKFTIYGSAAEPFVCDMASQLLNCRTRLVRYPDPLKKFMLTNINWPGMSATPDALLRVPRSWTQEALSASLKPFRYRGSARWVKRLSGALSARKGQTGVLELKTAHSKDAVEKWTEGPPTHYWSQVQVQLAICEYDWGILFGKLPHATFVAHFIEKDPVYLDSLRTSVQRFWEEVNDV